MARSRRDTVHEPYAAENADVARGFARSRAPPGAMQNFGQFGSNVAYEAARTARQVRFHAHALLRRSLAAAKHARCNPASRRSGWSRSAPQPSCGSRVLANLSARLQV